MVKAASADSLTEILAQDLLAAIEATPAGERRSVVLWLDPEMAFDRLWPHVAEELTRRGLTPLRCERSTNHQLATKIAVLRLEAEDGRGVVYLPGSSTSELEPKADGSAPELWSVYEYRYKGCLWTRAHAEAGELVAPPTLSEWLEHHGVSFATLAERTALVEGGRESLLARFAATRASKPLSSWPMPLRQSDTVAALGGDPRDALRQLLAAPTNAVRAWQRERELVFTSIREYFGLEVGDGEAPEELADDLTVQLALADAWDAFDRRPDFPFRSRLPLSDEQRDRAVRFARELLRDVELAPRFRTRMLRLEKKYDLSDWAADREGQPAGLPLLARARWRDFMGDFDALAGSDWKSARDLLLGSAAMVQAGSATPWGRGDGETPWYVLAEVLELLRWADQVATEAGAKSAVGDLVDAYVEGWWRLDRSHLRIRAACSRMSGLDGVRRVADVAYFDAVEAANLRLTELLDDAPEWPPGGSIPDVASLRKELWGTATGRRGVVIVDALRLDLGIELRDALDAQLRPVFATLPSTTPFGMSALLPLVGAAVSVHPKVAIDVEEGMNLATREGRKAFLLASVVSAAGKTLVDFVDLDDVLQGAPVPGAQVVVVFDNTIDEQGHKGTEEFPWVVEQLVAKLRRAVERLHEAGVAEVHVVTDHGFLLLPDDLVNDLGKPDVKVDQVLRRETRWAALKPGAPVKGMLRFSAPLAGDIELAFPLGTRTLVKSGGFVHGGISLQESVIPHVVSRALLDRSRVRVDVAVTTHRLVGGTVPVILRPATVGQASFGVPAAARVSVWVEQARAPESRVTELVELEVRSDAEELKPPLYLKEGLGLRAGQELSLRVIDAETGEELATVPLTLGVDWD